MYLIYLLLVFLASAYIYQTYLPYLYNIDENVFVLLNCLVYSLLYFCLVNTESSTIL